MGSPENALPSIIGAAVPRIDGPLKVSGNAMYTADFHFPGMVYAIPVCSTVAKGKITRLDASDAEKMPGVVAILHRENIGRLYRSARDLTFSAYLDERRPPFEDDVIYYNGQYVALAVAETFEQAQAAATAVQVSYSAEKPDVGDDLEPEGKLKAGSTRGDTEAAFANAPVKIDETYVTPVETHNPIELHASVSIWDGSKFTLYETTILGKALMPRTLVRFGLTGKRLPPKQRRFSISVRPTLLVASVAPISATLFGFNIARRIGLRSPTGLGGLAVRGRTGLLMLRRVKGFA
jgi:xanthine dehydrogenase YagR molybdenum-binding subunit